MDSIRWDGETLTLLDQAGLPGEEVWISCSDYRAAAAAMKGGAVLSPSALGIAGAYAYCLAFKEYQALADAPLEAAMAQAASDILESAHASRHLQAALSRMEQTLLARRGSPERPMALLAEAVTIHRQDVVSGRAAGRFGADIVPDAARVLLYGMTGGISAGGFGGALSVVRSAVQKGKVKMVYVIDGGPFVRCARLALWELLAGGISATLISGGAAASLMAGRLVDLVLSDGERMAADGSLRAPAGAYGLSICAYYHAVPFYTVLPHTAVDLSAPGADQLPPAAAEPEALSLCTGRFAAPGGQGGFFSVAELNPAYDIVSPGLVTGAITEKGILFPPFGREEE